jgi:hypothetical protein
MNPTSDAHCSNTIASSAEHVLRDQRGASVSCTQLPNLNRVLFERCHRRRARTPLEGQNGSEQ